jgi:flavin reductase (DIM6/NTAB) family NADH-FMN oxidoreductase RutF
VTATAVTSVCADPPTVLVCINTQTGTCKMIEEAGRFAVNMVALHHQPVAEIFAGRSGLQGDDRFSHGDWEVGSDMGLPILSTAIAALECHVEQVVANGTHSVFFGRVDSVAVKGDRPLIYHGGQFHALPFGDLSANEPQPIKIAARS